MSFLGTGDQHINKTNVKQIVLQSNLNRVGVGTLIQNEFRQFQPRFKKDIRCQPVVKDNLINYSGAPE